MPCFALGTFATGFLKSTAFLPAFSLSSVLAGLIFFFSDFFSAFFSGLAMFGSRRSKSKDKRPCAQKIWRWQGITSARTRFTQSLARVSSSFL